MKQYVTLFFFLASKCVFSQTPIDTTESLYIGGIQQFISINGKDNSKPLLLFLHGGPGGSVMSWSHKFTGKLENHFVVIQWDQRETGKTLALNSSPVPLTLKLFEDDTHELIETLLKRFNRTKLYLLGHSWGTVLGFHIVSQYPELLYAYIPIGPVINQLKSERIILSLMKEKAKQSSNQQEITELSKVNIPFENGEQLYFHRKWLLHFNGQKNPEKILSKDYVSSWANTWLSVWTEASKINLLETLPEVKCPVYFFVGRKDFQTNYSIAEDYFKKLKAPKKEFYWFEKSGHSLPSTEPGLMQEIIIQKILPATFNSLPERK